MTDRERRQKLGACYSMGQIKQGQIAGEYPPPPADIPNCPVDLSADAESRALLQGSGIGRTVTGRLTRETPPFEEIPRARKATSVRFIDLDLSEIELKVLASMENKHG